MRKMLVILALLLMIAVVPASAQTAPPEDTPVVRMLSHVPNTIEARSGLSYVDYEAMYHSREGVPEFSTWDEFQTALRGDNGNLVMAALNGIRSGPQFLQNIMRAEDVPDVMGFDFFDIDQAVTFSQPPAEVMIVQGDFAPQAVIAAHEARGFTESEVNDIPLLCGDAGCENGMELDLLNQNVSNLFGGELGRSQPTLVTETWIASSPDIDMIHSVAETASAAESSLAEQPDYRSAVEALEAAGTLRQGWFLLPSDVMSPSEYLANGRLSAEQAKALEEQMREDFVPMPAWNIAVLADVATETDQQAVVALVYTDQADAEAAAAQFPERFTNATSFMTMQTFSDILADRGMTSVEDSVYASMRERYVLLVTLHYPLASNEFKEGEFTQASSLLYTVLPQAFLARDVGWLAPEF